MTPLEQNYHPEFLAIVNHMADHGFVVYDLPDDLFRSLDGALVQIDVAFVKEDGPFREDTSWM